MRPVVKRRNGITKGKPGGGMMKLIRLLLKKTVLESVEAGWWQRTIPTGQTKCETNSLHCKEDR